MTGTELTLEGLIDDLTKTKEYWDKENEWVAKGIDLAISKVSCALSAHRLIKQQAEEHFKKTKLIRSFVKMNSDLFATKEELEELKHYFAGGSTHCKGVENDTKKEDS